ncbi:MAG: hypothetical protein ACTHLH_05220, partial [Solirubrobacterales bacterium]
MRRLILVSTLLALAVGLAGSALGTGLSAAFDLVPCGPPGKTVVTGGRARVYRKENVRSREWMVFGCVSGSKPQRLDRPQEIDPSQPTQKNPWLLDELIVLHSPWVAYLEHFVRVDSGIDEVAALNLRNGKFRHCEIGPWASNGPSFNMAGIVVTRQG